VALVLGLGPVLGTAPAVAQALGATPQILTLDQDRLYTDSLYGKAMEARALADSRVLAAENRQIEADLAKEEADLTQKRSGMSAADFQALADAFDAKVEKLRTDQAAKADALKAERDAGRKTFFQAAVPVLGDLMHEIGALAILNHDAVVLSFDSIDVTDRAIKALDQKLGDGSTVPQGPRLPPPDGGVSMGEPVPPTTP
jgi:Skp family chaperone for outer membrane proteins